MPSSRTPDFLIFYSSFFVFNFDPMICRPFIRLMMAGLWVSFCLQAFSQRVYTANSVLATGNWYKFSVHAPGIYKIDLPFLNSLGINTSSLSSASVRIFGNGGHMLPEKPGDPKTDDLAENAIWVEDGGDGQLNGQDYMLFYAHGPHAWIKDSANKSFHHQKNVYSDSSYYYITIGGNGKRITTLNLTTPPNITINQVTHTSFYELDTVNLLSSG